jgi:hypothetical protein
MADTKAVAKVLASGYMFDAKAFDKISELPPGSDIDAFVERLLEQKLAAGREAKLITESDVTNAFPPGDSSPSSGGRDASPVCCPGNGTSAMGGGERGYAVC